ncbi:tetratricopeptide repeat protein [Lignipirellula cremea]|uniref:Tetratricopeptide repeat protein n=1 Tax=Lignipirellula cremea TaxID=2528010 RepID=A0A518DUG1_9BACT|nr:hypothetical protein [Lignipirellula cremea]QDU95477.1 Tetratricopeptide repeat protein [Lignipirellula cremea]
MFVSTDDYSRACNAWHAGDLDRALHISYTALSKDEDNGRLWELRGLIHRDRGEPHQCADAIERASLLTPLQPLARVCLAEAYGQLNRRELARDLYRELFHASDMTVALLLQTAVGLDAIDQPALAMRACQNAIELDPLASQPYYDMGYYAARCGRPPQVVESLARKAISLDPDRVSYRVGLAALMLKHERFEEAYEVVSHISQEQIRSVRCRCCLVRLVSLFEQSGDATRAEQSRQQVDWLTEEDIQSGCD